MVDEKKALLYSSIKPDNTQEGKILKFLTSKYGENVTLDWVEDKSVTDGFRLEIGKEVYDWTRAGRLEQFKERIGKTVGKNKKALTLPPALNYNDSTVHKHISCASHAERHIICSVISRPALCPVSNAI